MTGSAALQWVDHDTALTRVEGTGMPALVSDAGEDTARRFVEFFTVTLRNPHTRAAYGRAAWRFLQWAESRDLELRTLSPVAVAAYVELLTREHTPATVKQHVAALRRLFAWLVTGGALPRNPFTDVQPPRLKVRRGKTPVLFEDEARALIDRIDVTGLVGLRDRAMIGVMLYSFARVSAMVAMRVRDFEVMGTRASIVLHEKGGRFHRVPAHHKACEYLEAYLAEAGIREDLEGPLFRVTTRSGAFVRKPLNRYTCLQMIKRRARAAALPPGICNHTFRATGITNYMAHGGGIEVAAEIAGHASTQTTQIYDRNPERIELSEIERIRI